MKNKIDHRKRILLVFPGLRVNNDEGSKHRLNSFIDSYTDLGFRVTVLAFAKDFLSFRPRYLNKKSKWIVLPCILPISKARILTDFLISYYKLLLAIISYVYKFDIIQMEMYGIRSSIANRKCKYIVDFHGDSYNEFVESGSADSKHWFAEFLLDLESKSIAEADYAICVTENLKLQLEKNTNMKIKHYSLISCGVDLRRFNVSPIKRTSIMEELTEDRIVIGYCGGLQQWQNIDKILDVTIALHQMEPRIFFVLYTNSDIRSIQTRLTQLGRHNCFVKALHTDEVPSYLKIMDAGFLLRDDLILNRVSSPTKISEYLAAGAGLICTPYSGDYKELTVEGENCFVLRDYDNDEYVHLLSWLKKFRTERKDLSFLADYTFYNQCKRFCESFFGKQ